MMRYLWGKLPALLRYSLESAAAWGCLGVVAGVIGGIAAAADPVLAHTPAWQDFGMTLIIALAVTLPLGFFGGLLLWCLSPFDRFLYTLYDRKSE